MTILPNNNTDEATVAQWGGGKALQNTIGWIVCTSGTYIGKSFPLRYGNNFVGKSMESDVALPQINEISRERHCNIVYDAENKKLFIQNSDLGSQIFVNQEKLDTYMPLEHKSVIKMGNVDFVVFLLCSENFDWDDYSND